MPILSFFFLLLILYSYQGKLSLLGGAPYKLRRLYGDLIFHVSITFGLGVSDKTKKPNCDPTTF